MKSSAVLSFIAHLGVIVGDNCFPVFSKFFIGQKWQKRDFNRQGASQTQSDAIIKMPDSDFILMFHSASASFSIVAIDGKKKLPLDGAAQWSSISTR
jgi:hypothetical protein